jgi:hypothetical protein
MFRTNQWFTLSIVLLIALMARLSLAETTHKGHKATKRSTASQTTTTTTTTTETVALPSKHNLELSVGPDLAILGDGWGTGIGVQFGILTQVSPTMPLYVGGDFGLNLWSGPTTSFNPMTGASSSAGMVGLQMLPTAIYRFDIPGTPSIRPYAGISVGPALHFASLGSGLASNTTLYFEGLVRPGVEFTVSRRFAVSVEPKLGLLSDQFLFMPTAYATFSL